MLLLIIIGCALVTFAGFAISDALGIDSGAAVLGLYVVVILLWEQVVVPVYYWLFPRYDWFEPLETLDGGYGGVPPKPPAHLLPPGYKEQT